MKEKPGHIAIFAPLDNSGLALHLTEEPKPEVMRQLARQLVSEAREAMESSTRNGCRPS